ncbi:hypothetical protein OPKNFCMD_5641 [Methylobacterium crusticola]|uniref:ABC transmembrane type-1 domain-containing protein n=1 Tax=Methylobacterium crusticola TaxID=1697972 RepID=A0ABQ4R6M3_9HYPH|nr:ABC transporter permease subunit [Methylobacterium crusticola]GJD52874.1 hypothetical protein OPKNFCMD_5641 [Methylobacterium crusticola]
MSGAARPPARTGGRDALVAAGLLLALWQGLHLYAGDAALASPAAALGALRQLAGTAAFWGHCAATAQAFAAALALSAAIGLALGLWLGLRRFAGEVAEPLLAGLYAIPKITLYPVILLVFGLGLGAKVAFGVIHGFVPIALFTLGAVKSLDPVLLRTARALRLSRAQTVRFVLAPAALPEIVAGLRVGFSLTLLGVLIGEMFASQAGLGFLIVNGTALHNVRLTTAVILTVVVLAVGANAALLWLDRRYVRRG